MERELIFSTTSAMMFGTVLPAYAESAPEAIDHYCGLTLTPKEQAILCVEEKSAEIEDVLNKDTLSPDDMAFMQNALYAIKSAAQHLQKTP